MSAFVTILSDGLSGEAGPIEEALRGVDIEVRLAAAPEEIDEQSDLVLVLQAEKQGSAFNAYALKKGITWLPVQFSHTVGRIGPLIIPKVTACFACMELRSGSNGVQPLLPKANRFAVSWSLISAIAATETIKWVSRHTNNFSPLSLGHVIEFDAFHLQGDVNPVYKLPTCPSCGVRHQAHLAAQPWREAELVHDL
ncbi:TOMM precursor leader peptide-binding protein [Paenibacillus xanthanilyticus]|uniref:TOMM leader peptide-binding protein n=1 Tax=Paenibacillus xanthanilyticus TaxID=1783531 RepID=A0ABV8K1T6_9BACL